jgi:hypothetical protein
MKYLVILFLLLSSTAFPQRYIWEKNFGTARAETAVKMMKTADNGYIIVYDVSAINGAWIDSYWFVKTDSAYNVKWQKSFNGDRLLIWDITQTYDSGYIACGVYFDPILGTYPYLVRLDKNSDTVWTKKYKTWQNLDFIRVSQLSDSNILVRLSYIPDKRPVLKMNLNGDTIWRKEADFDNRLIFKDTLIVTSPNYFRKFNNEGKIVYNKILNLKYSPAIGIHLKGGGYAFAGYFNSEGVFLVKMNESGDTAWTRTYYAFGRSIYTIDIYDITETADSGLLVLGKLTSFGSYGYLFKADKYGNKQWEKSISSNWGAVEPNALFLNCDSSITIFATVDPGPMGGTDVFLEGIDSLPHVYGPCELRTGIEQPTQLKEVINIYPNPSNSVINIHFNNPLNGTLSLYNTVGSRVVQQNINGQVNIKIDISDLEEGLYLLNYTDNTGNNIFQQKLIKTK